MRYFLVASVLALVLVVSSIAGAARPVPVKLSYADTQAIRHSADYILGCQMSNGFIPMTQDDKIWGVSCFATMGALGLLRAYQVTADQRYIEGAKRFVDWYASHMETNGTMCDWTGTRNAPVSTHDYDSSDGYPPDFLVLCYDIYRITHDTAWLQERYPAIALSVNGMLLTWQSDGLTYGKPTYKVKYLMDNLSVHYGLRAATKIAEALGTPDLAKWKTLMEQNRVGLTKFWLKDEGRFSPAIFEDGNIDKDWAKWYPDGMANAFALICILGKSDPKARALYQKLNAQFSENDYFQALAAWKFESSAASRKVGAGLSACKHSLDHSNYIRYLVPRLDSFFYSEEKLTLPSLR